MFNEPDAFEEKLRTLRNLAQISPFSANAIFNPQLLPVQQSIHADRKITENEIVPEESAVENKEMTTVAPSNEESKVVPEEAQTASKPSLSKLPKTLENKPKEEVESSKVSNFEVDFQVDMPNPSDDKTSKAPITEKVEDATTTVAPEPIKVLDDGKLTASLLLSMLTGSNLWRNNKPGAPVAVKSKCDAISCLQPPKELTCHLQKASIKINNPENSKFEELSDCCPLWLCTKPDGSFHTHYGMIGKIDEEKDVAPPASKEEAIPFISFSRSLSSQPQEQARDKPKMHMLILTKLFKTTKFSPQFPSISPDSGLNDFSPFANLGGPEPVRSGAALGSSQNREVSITSEPGFFSTSIKTPKTQNPDSTNWNQLMEKLKMSSGGQLMLQQEKESPQSQFPLMLPFFPPGLI